MSQADLNCNLLEAPKTSDSTEDLSQYTDANESISAPIELLAEFLSAVMVKSYRKALDYCKQILLYEPNNATAKEFYPLIMDKLELNEEGEYDESTPESSNNSSTSCSEDNCSCSRGKEDSDATSASYSSLEDEEADLERDEFRTDEMCKLKLIKGNTDAQNNEVSPFHLEKTSNHISTTTVDILIHSSPTVTLKRENTIVLSRNETYTKNFSEHISNQTNESKIQVNEKNNEKNISSNKKTSKKRGNINFNASKKSQKKIN